MVSTTQNRISYLGNGVTTAFAFPYYFKNPADLIVLLVTTATRVVVPLILNVDYSVSGIFTPPFGYKTGGAVNIPGGSANVPAVLTGAQELILIRSPSNIQNLSLPANSSYPPVSTEAEFDSIVLMLQRAMDLLSRAATLKDGMIGNFDPSLPADIGDAANKGCVLITNPDGSNNLVMGPDVSNIAGVAAAAAQAVAAAASAAADAIIATEASVLANEAAADAAANLQAMQAFASDPILVDTSGGDVPESLPVIAPGTKYLVTYINKSFGSGFNIVVTPLNGGDTIMGAANLNIGSGEVVTLWYDGIDTWWIRNSV